MQIISVWRHCPIWRHSFATLPSAMGEKYNIFLLVSSWAYSLSLVSFAAFRFDFPTFVLVSFALSLLSSLPLFTITLSCVSLMLHSNGNRWQINYCKTLSAYCAERWVRSLKFSKSLLSQIFQNSFRCFNSFIIQGVLIV